VALQVSWPHPVTVGADPTDRARSTDGTAYAQWAALGTAVAGALRDHTDGALSCTSGATATSFTGAAGTQAVRRAVWCRSLPPTPGG